jgi:MscS family membrane protein
MDFSFDFSKDMLNQTFLNQTLSDIAIAMLIFFLFLFLRKLFTSMVLKTLGALTKKTKTNLDDKILNILLGPLRFMFIIIGIYISIGYLNIDQELISKFLKSMIIFTIFWFLYGLVDVFSSTVYQFTKKFGKELHKEIALFIIKSLKIFIFSIGAVAVLQSWDINVSTFIASLGLGGLAFALAAKDTAANLFGGLTILADSSLKIGDWIKVNSIEGVVEDIGLRTIKVRTFEKSLITLPNQIVANNPIENFSKRGIRRIKMRIGLEYSSTNEQIVNIRDEINQMLKNHPKIAQNATMLVRFDRFEDSSLSIFIYTFTSTANWDEYLQIREDVNLKIISIVEKNNAAFAFPSLSIYTQENEQEIKEDIL